VLSGTAIDQHVVVRIIADEPDSARTALERANIRFEEEEVVKVLLENRAGELAVATKKLGEAGVNLRAIYLTASLTTSSSSPSFRTIPRKRNVRWNSQSSARLSCFPDASAIPTSHRPGLAQSRSDQRLIAMDLDIASAE
jgi:hypothetical protein